MKRTSLAITILVLSFVIAGSAVSRDTEKGRLRAVRTWSYEDFAGQDVPIREYMQAAAAVDTYEIIYYDFEVSDWQGWTRFDNTGQVDTFWHVEDYSDPELAGLPGPLEGEKSMWCGAPPAPEYYMCHWSKPPGYGNGWNQHLVLDPVQYTGVLKLSFKGYFDSEPDYDRTVVEYAHFGYWKEVASYDGVVDTVVEHHIHAPLYMTKLRFHFVSDGAWSDQDGLWNTNGAAHIDSITVADDNGVLDYEDFEAASVGDKMADGDGNHCYWRGSDEDAFGKYSGLWFDLQAKDPCGVNHGSQIVFFIGSEEESTEYPGLYNTPRCHGPGGIEAPCQDEIVISPVIDLTRHSTGRNNVQDAEIPPGDLPGLGGALLRFTVYRDLTYSNLVYYNWGVRSIVDGCPGYWEKRTCCYYGDDQRYAFEVKEISDLLDSDSIQVHLRILDMCSVWYGVYGDCAEHTPSPWFDNVRVQRYETAGPQFTHRRMDLFQDNFPEEEFDIESFVRADAANDIRPNDEPIIDPGDSVTVTCDSPLCGGIRYSFLGPDSLPEVYMHVKCASIGCDDPPKPDLFGPALEGTYGKYESDDGIWTVIRGEEARRGSGSIARDQYMFDLNDSLLTRGYMVEYYFTANDNVGLSGSLPEDAADGVYFEFTCLPTLCHEILYVDDFDGRGSHEGIVHNYFAHAFPAVVPDAGPAPPETMERHADRYDVNQPSSLVGNGLGGRAKPFQMIMAYNTVIWDSGDLAEGTITDGTEDRGKSNDCQLLVTWLNLDDHDVGLWVLGDNVARDLNESITPQALELMSAYCGVAFGADSYYDLTGRVSPKVAGLPGSPFYHAAIAPDTFCVYGGCPTINGFDCLIPTINGQPALEYGSCGCPDQWEGSGHYAGIWSARINDGGFNIRTVWFGFSYMYMRDCDHVLPPMRFHILDDVLSFFGMAVNMVITGDEDEMPSYVYSLSQNYPNPFNPATTIRFSLREKGKVSIRIYDVAGRLVKTLVDEVRDAGAHAEPWDGLNNRGAKIASGVYFYKMESRHFSSTRKMVLLR
jgi:hypothetical protein